MYCLLLDAKCLIFVAMENWRQNYSGEEIFLGRFDFDEEQGFTGVSSFFWDRKVITEATRL
jgi:hypothetical protein